MNIKPKIVIYTKPGCGYCVRAMALLDEKGASYQEIIASVSPEIRSEMVTRAHGRNTFPQIFIGSLHVGGCDDLFSLEQHGKLDLLLKETLS